MPAVRLMHDVGSRIADALDDLAIERGIARGRAGFGIAHMDMRDRGARLRRLDRGGRDLARG